MEYLIYGGLFVSGFAIALIFSWTISSRMGRKLIAKAEESTRQLQKDAEKQIETLKREKLLEAKDEWYRLKQEFETEAKQKRQELEKSEKYLTNKEMSLDRRADLLNKTEREVKQLEVDLKKHSEEVVDKEKQLNEQISQYTVQLERIAALSSADAKKMLMESMVDQAKQDASRTMREIVENARLNAGKEAKEIIIQAMQRLAADQAIENSVSVVSLPNDEMKGRIIGREGRNIRAFETATGVEVIVDDTPEAVVLSAFDPVRREVARIALERLVADGRIHPARIEEVVGKAEAEVEESMVAAGEQAILDCGISRMHPELVKTMGKLRYRTSYGQNVLQHSVEVARLTGIMAQQLQLDQKAATRAGLLHDLGKAIDHEEDADGTHIDLGVDLARRFNEGPVVLNAIAAHHEGEEIISPITVLVKAADALSSARPGARRVSLESTVKRLENLEGIARSFKGVSKSYAIQAGREIRVIVEPNKINDSLADMMSKDIAEKIQDELEYPGTVKVTVIREYRSVQYAK